MCGKGLKDGEWKEGGFAGARRGRDDYASCGHKALVDRIGYFRHWEFVSMPDFHLPSFSSHDKYTKLYGIRAPPTNPAEHVSPGLSVDIFIVQSPWTITCRFLSHFVPAGKRKAVFFPDYIKFGNNMTISFRIDRLKWQSDNNQAVYCRKVTDQERNCRFLSRFILAGKRKAVLFPDLYFPDLG